MHYDKKVALGLGVLLVGIVGALFFRREAASDDDGPQLVDAKSLDERIAEKPVRPYDAPPEKATSARNVSSNDDRPTVSFEDAFAADDRISQRGPEPADNPTSLQPPEPIRPQNGGGVGMIPVPDHNAAWLEGSGTTTAKPNPKRRPAPGNPDSPPNGYREYEVRRGDTLSGIAARFLGSSGRYREVYEANRDRMRSLIDLRPGMRLRIPTRRRPGTPAVRTGAPASKSNQKSDARTKPQPASNADSNSDSRQPGKSPAAGPGGGKFKPVRRSPFIMGQLLRGNSAAADSPREDEPSANKSEPPSRPRTYTVQRGDSLEKIAVRFYGDRNAVAKILKANAGGIADPSRVYAGMQIKLP